MEEVGDEVLLAAEVRRNLLEGPREGLRCIAVSNPKENQNRGRTRLARRELAIPVLLLLAAFERTPRDGTDALD